MEIMAASLAEESPPQEEEAPKKAEKTAVKKIQAKDVKK